MKTKTLILATMMMAMAQSTCPAGTAGSYPQKTTLAGTEKVYLDDGGTDKHGLVSAIRAVAASTSGTIAGATIITSTYNGNTWTAGTGTLTLGAGKTITLSNTLTFTGTDSSSVAFGSGGTVAFQEGTLAQFASTTSVQLATLLSNETGSGVAVFATSPTLVTPTIGVATATSVNKVAITAPATSATLTIADGKTLTASNTLTFTGTDASSVAFGTGGTVAYQGGTLAQFASTTSAQLATLLSNETGSGVAVFATSPTLVTPVLGVATATSVNKVALTAPATGSTLTIADGKTLTASNTLTFTGTDSTSFKFPAVSATVLVSSLSTNAVDAANSIWAVSNGLVMEGATADAYETTITPVDPTADQTVSVPNFAVSYALLGTTLTTNTVGAANAIWGVSNALTFEGATADTSEGTLTWADLTADVTYKLPDAAAATYGIMLSTLATNAPDIANSVYGVSAALSFEGPTADAYEGILTFADPTADRTVTFANASGTVILSALSTNAQDAANSIWGVSNGLSFEGATADAYETTFAPTDPTADRTLTLPDASGVVSLAQASTTTALTADNQAVTPGSNTRLQLTSDDATATNRTFTLSATGAITGQIYVIIGPATNQCELADTGIQKLSAAWSPGAADTLTLMFDGTNFIELGRADN